MIGQEVLIVGASGLIGGFCLNRLVEEEDVARVVVLARRPLGPLPGKLRQHLIDFDRLADYGSDYESDYASLFKVDTVFCCLGTTLKAAGNRAAFEKVDYGYVRQLAELAAAGGASKFLLVSAVGAHPRSPVFYSRVKGRVEAAVCRLPFRSVHILRPSMLLGPRREPRRNEEILAPVARMAKPLLLGPLRRLRPVAAETVAATMVELARDDAPGVHIHYPSAL